MKILTGRLKGRSIAFKANPRLRPTADKVRQAVFDMLRAEIDGKRALDLFSGTGALGFEALSMGAASVDFVERDGAQCRRIREDLKALDLGAFANVHAGDAVSELERMAKKGEGGFEVIFLDPPYDTALGPEALSALSRLGLAAPGAWAVLEGRKTDAFPRSIGGWKLAKEKYYGDTRVGIYQFNE